MARAVEIHEPDDPTWALGERRLSVLRTLADMERTSVAAVDAAARELGIKRGHLYRLLRRFRADPTVTAVLPRARGRMEGARLLSPEVEALVTAAIDDFYLTRNTPKVSQLMREVERRSAELGLAPPSRKAVTARIRLRDQVEVLRRRHGAAHARAKLGRIVGRLSVDKPLGLVQVDHTQADVILVSETDRRVLGRPWLTLAIDVATRVVAGFHLSLEAPSSLSVALALNHAVLPKDAYLRERGMDLVWPVAGLPERLHLDNAKEFRGKALVRGASQYGIELVYRPPAAPHWGGHIERLIGTTMGALTILPGATGRNTRERPADAEASAAMTLDELESWLVHQIAGVYHHTVHRSLGTTPVAAWNAATEGSHALRRLPPDEDRFCLDLLPFEHRTVGRAGISLFNVTYSDGVLSTLLAKPKQRFLVRYDPRDLSRVFLRDEAGTYWPIPYSDRRLPPATLAEINAATRRLRAAGEHRVTSGRIFKAIEEQRALVAAARATTKAVRRESERTRLALRNTAKLSRNGEQPQRPQGHDADDVEIRPYPVEEWS